MSSEQLEDQKQILAIERFECSRRAIEWLQSTDVSEGNKLGRLRAHGMDARLDESSTAANKTEKIGRSGKCRYMNARRQTA